MRRLLAGEPAEPFGQLGPDPPRPAVRRRACPVRPRHQTDQHGAGRVGARVDEERNARRQHEQEPAERPGDHALHQRGPADQPAVGPLQASPRHHGGSHRLARGAEHHLARIDDEQHAVQQGDARPAGQQRGGQDAHRGGTTQFIAIISRRRSTRSTSTPPGSANSSQGSHATPVVADTISGLLVCAATYSGAAMRVRPLPSADIVLAAHSPANLRPSGSAITPGAPRGTRRARAGSARSAQPSCWCPSPASSFGSQ